jgi:peptidyl-prolyl cis-trans isomerase C
MVKEGLQSQPLLLYGFPGLYIRAQMNIQTRIFIFLSALLTTFNPVFAQDGSPTGSTGQDNGVFATQGDVVLTQDELDAAFMGIPVANRLAFIRDGEKVERFVKSLLRNKLIAADAQQAGFDQGPMVRKRLQLAADKELAETWIVNLVENAPDADYEAMALEHYLANPDEYRTPEMVDVSHILIGSDSRSEQDALEIASKLTEDLQADPSQFDAFVLEYSEDPAKKSNGGRYPGVQRGQMVKPFEAAAFSLEEPGQISDPVKTNYGYHIIRLNKKMLPELLPFDQLKEGLMQQAKEKYLSDLRLRYIRELTAAPIDVPESAVEAMVKRWFGEELELAPEFPE